MERRPLGNTGLNVSILGFGSSPLGNVYGDIDKSEGIAAVHHSLKNGCNYFDSSPYYGLTLAETVLGEALSTAPVPRSEYYIATKVGRYGASEFDFSREKTFASVQESLKRLQTDYIDVIQCHDIEFGDIDVVVNECIPALQELKAKGIVKFIGITGLPLGVLKATLARLSKGDIDMVLSYCKLSLNDDSLSDYVSLFKDSELGIVNASPLSMGLLSGNALPSWHPAPDLVKQKCAEAAEFCRSRGESLPEIALRYSVWNRGADIATTLVGLHSKELWDLNAAAVAKGPAPQEIVDEILAILKPVQRTTWPSGKYKDNETLL